MISIFGIVFGLAAVGCVAGFINYAHKHDPNHR